MDGRADKATLRRTIGERLARIPSDERLRRSDALAARLVEDARWRRAGARMGYLAFGTELDLGPTLRRAHEQGHRVCVPSTDWERRTIEPVGWTPDSVIEAGRHGVPAVVDGARLDLAELGVILVPGVAFDERGGRLGRGGGFYDRFLERCLALGEARPVFVGVGFLEQRVDRVPLEGHDVRLDTLILV